MGVRWPKSGDRGDGEEVGTFQPVVLAVEIQRHAAMFEAANVEPLDEKGRRHPIGHGDQCGCRDHKPGLPRRSQADPFDQRQGLEAAGPGGLHDVGERRTCARREPAVRGKRHRCLDLHAAEARCIGTVVATPRSVRTRPRCARSPSKGRAARTSRLPRPRPRPRPRDTSRSHGPQPIRRRLRPSRHRAPRQDGRQWPLAWPLAWPHRWTRHVRCAGERPPETSGGSRTH
jgi:hypothetical protein